MRVFPLLLALGFTAGCGHGTPGFVIDNVAVSPDEIPIASGSSELLKIRATVTDDLHDVLDVWANSDEGPLWIDMPPSKSTADVYSGSVPIRALDGFPAGNYLLDLHATDSGGREADLADAVRLRIREN